MLTSDTRNIIAPTALPIEALSSIVAVDALSPVPHFVQYFKPLVV